MWYFYVLEKYFWTSLLLFPFPIIIYRISFLGFYSMFMSSNEGSAKTEYLSLIH